jgi:hypothetical protein
MGADIFKNIRVGSTQVCIIIYTTSNFLATHFISKNVMPIGIILLKIDTLQL